jgi:hypothetical protein
MQTAINPALAAAMTLERAAQVGEFQPTTPDGQPTVAAQLMQKAVPPAVPDVVKQAGLGGQIQAMQMQDAQKELMGRLMAQQKQAPGLMGLNPQMGNFAEGGIVGYQAGGVTGEFGDISALLSDQAENPQNIVDQIKGYFDRLAREGRQAEEAQKMQFLEQNAPGVAARVKSERAATQAPVAPAVDSGAQMQANMDAMRAAERRMTPAAAPGQPPAAPARAPSNQGIAGLTGAAAMRQSALDLMNAFKAPPTPGEVRGQAEASAKERQEFERSQGLDPQYLAKELQAAQQRGQERMSYADRLASELEERRKDEGIINFLLGARGLKGQGIGEVFRTGALSSRAAAAESRAEARKIQEMRLAYEDASVKERQSLELARRAVAAGDWKSGQDYMNNARKFHNDKVAAEADMRKSFAGQISSEEIEKGRLSAAAKERQEGRETRRQSADETLLRSYDATVATAIEKAEKILAELHPTGKLFNTSVEARKSNPEGYRQYQADRKRLYDEMVVPAERNRKALQDRMQGYSGWGQVNVQ